MSDAQTGEPKLDYELAVIFFEHVRSQMTLAIAIGDVDLIDEIQPELAAAAAAVRATKAPRAMVN